MTRRTLGNVPRGTRGPWNAGLTTMEVMIAGLIAAIILLAAFSMYLTSMETWDLAGARLALQRNGDRVVKTIASDIRHGDTCVVSADSLSISIMRTVSGTTTTLATYALSGTEVVNDHGVVLTGDVQELRFWTQNGEKVWISLTLMDDMGTSSLPFDDQRVEINSVAICRNEAS